MKMTRCLTGLMILTGLMAGCAVAPRVAQDNALPQMPLSELIAHVDGYMGQAVVMGGYVFEVENQQDQTRIVAVQAPIGSGQRVKSKDLSEGRLILIYDGFIDPEVYTKGREITVGGEVLGGSANDSEVSYPYLRIKVRDIYLWPEETVVVPDHYWGYDPFSFYPYSWYRLSPYWRYPGYYYPSKAYRYYKKK